MSKITDQALLTAHGLNLKAEMTKFQKRCENDPKLESIGSEYIAMGKYMIELAVEIEGLEKRINDGNKTLHTKSN